MTNRTKTTLPKQPIPSRIFLDNFFGEKPIPTRPSDLLDAVSDSNPIPLNPSAIRQRTPSDFQVTGVDPVGGTVPSNSLSGNRPSITDDLKIEFLKLDYKIVRLIGEGGMGSVYEARYIGEENALGIPNDSRVAIKVLSERFSDCDQTRTRFLREATISTALKHPNIVRVYDVGELSKKLFFVMEYLEGSDLANLIFKKQEKRELLGVDHSLFISREICLALIEAHSKGIIHRDIKGENIFLTHVNGVVQVKIIDLGIAKIVNKKSEGLPRLTSVDVAPGTPTHMAPELVPGYGDAGGYDHRVDIYSLGVTMYEMFTGTLPFDSNSATGLMYMHKFTPPIPLNQKNNLIPQAVNDIVMKCLEKDPNKRFSKVEEILNAIESLGIIGEEKFPNISIPPVHATQKSNVPIKRNNFPKIIFGIMAGVAGFFTTGYFIHKNIPLTPEAPAPSSSHSIKPADSLFEAKIEANVTSANVFIEERVNGLLIERHVGVTPFKERFRGETLFFIEKPGYQRAYITLDPNNPTSSIILEKR